MIQLEGSQFASVTQALKGVGINHLFARSVLEGIVDGLVYVDQMDDPGAFYVSHPYGMSLLFGESGLCSFRNALWDHLNDRFSKRPHDEWLQVYPESWAKDIRENCQGFENHTRVNFKFNKDRYLANKNVPDNSLHEWRIARTDEMTGPEIHGSVVPRYFWRGSEDFSKNGVGCSVVLGDQPVSTAFSAFIHDGQLELGIETVKQHRGKGYALWACSALIDYCLENDLEPVWACRLENKASFYLAKKLGFEPSAYIPYFRLLAHGSTANVS